MKKLFFIALFTLTAHAQAGVSVLIESSTHVGFAPPQYRGIFKLQILSDGTLQKIDNKQKVTKFAKLSGAAVKNLNQQIATLQIGELQGEDGPLCTDAPMRKTIVNKNAEEIVIKTNISCNTKEMSTAYNLNRIIDSAESMFSALNQ